MGVMRRLLFPGLLAILLVAPVMSQTAPGSVANPTETQLEIQQHIDHVTSGLTTAVIDNNDPHPGMTLSGEMAALHVPGVSIAVVHNGVEFGEGAMGVRRFLFPGLLAILLVAPVLSQTVPGSVANSAETQLEIQRHIDDVTSGLMTPIIDKNDPHPGKTLSDEMAALHVPGVSIAVVHNGVIEWAQGFGFAVVGGDPVTAETLFQAGSISKPVAAMAALRLVQEGKLNLDADINTYLTSWKLPASEVAAGKPVTLRELLTHTGGTTVHGFPGYAAGETVPTLVQVLDGVKPANTAAIRVDTAPGTKWRYSGGGFTIMQQALIDVTKEPFPKLMHDTVLAPIGMTHSTYRAAASGGVEGEGGDSLRWRGQADCRAGRIRIRRWRRRDCGRLLRTWRGM